MQMAVPGLLLDSARKALRCFVFAIVFGDVQALGGGVWWMGLSDPPRALWVPCQSGSLAIFGLFFLGAKHRKNLTLKMTPQRWSWTPLPQGEEGGGWYEVGAAGWVGGTSFPVLT